MKRRWNWRLVRGGLFYGPGTLREERWLAEVGSESFRLPGDGNAWISPVHVEDLAEALIAVIERGSPREAYIACDDTPLRLRELYARVAARAGVALPAGGGEPMLRSFRVANAKLRSLGWYPLRPELRL
ncbi:MAG: hypothetical protein HYR50_12290 [Candidatus Rokubacteria bacterium]|nr:hypothetical protein [Candidatus Rokubacteria bacterium]